MTAIDLIILMVFLISISIGFFRGFTFELLSLTSWVFSFWAAFYFMDDVSLLYHSYIQIDLVRSILSFFSVLIPLLILCGITSRMLGKLTRGSTFGNVDRTAGAIFGFLRSSVIVLLSLFFLRIFFSNATWWQESAAIPIFIKAMESLEKFSPILFDSDAFI